MSRRSTAAQRSSAPETWATYRRRRLTEAAAHVHIAALAVELIPADEDSARVTRMLYRISARLASDAKGAA